MPLTVALPDPRWYGHHPTYFREFTASLLRNHCHVLALCSGHESFADHIKQNGLGEHVTVKPLYDRARSYFARGREHDPINTLDRWIRVRTALNAAERTAGRRADLVFFPFLDSMLRFQILPGAGFSRILGRPWAGLYFRNHHFAEPDPKILFVKGDHTLRSSGCIAAGALDERYLPQMEAFAPGTPFFQWPDITDETPATGSTELTRKLHSLAGARKVVGLIGMERRKGVLTLLRAATEDPRMKRYFFAFTGDFVAETYSAAELRFVDKIAAEVAAGKHDHIYLNAKHCRIPDGVEFNTLFSSFDIVYAAYENFCGSSNSLTKSAVFNRPVIATAGECVGRRVEEYGLGETIPEGDANAAADAIVSLAENGTATPPRYKEYHARHNRAQLDRAFARILGLIGDPKCLPSAQEIPAAATLA